MARRRGQDGAGPSAYRFEATVHPGAAGGAPPRAADLDPDLDLDLVPDPDGGLRAVVDADGLADLLELGYEVRLHGVVPVRPLDAALVRADDDDRAWLEARVEGIPRQEGS